MTMKTTLRFSAAAAVAMLLLTGCDSEPLTKPAVIADTIYHQGTILTMRDAEPQVEAVAVRAGAILAAGGEQAILEAYAGPETTLFDLAGQTLLPGFVDSHSHFSQVGLQAISANLLPPPDGPAQSIADIQRIMREFIETSSMIEDFGLAIGFNYDDSQLIEQRAPTRQELDAVSTDVPILIIHQSGHLGVYNSLALEQLNITSETSNPEGGVIYREADGVTPNGLLAENAHIDSLIRMLPRFTQEQMMGMLAAAQAVYLQNGFTTVQDGRTDPSGIGALIHADRSGVLNIDAVAYPDLVMSESSELLTGPYMSRDYQNHFRIGGVKLSLDGSPQGKTAWFTEPYFMPPPGESEAYAGFPIFADEAELARLIDITFEQDWQLMVHANGDAAIDQMIRMLEQVGAGYPKQDRRPVLIHGQYLRADQIPHVVELGIFPSLYPMHTFYWGDWHRDSVAGPARAEFISPTAAVQAEGIRFGIHSDAPVTFPNSMRILDSAVNRTTRSGYVLGADQRIDALTALKAMTLWPAYQHFEEARKGSIKAGKVADFVLLSDNPLTIERSGLIDLKVMATIKEGEILYQAE